jgi:hypothetical protein
MSNAFVFLRQPLVRVEALAKRLDRFVNGDDLIVSNLATVERRSLLDALANAAIVAEIDPANGDIRIRHAQNRMFRPDHFTTVIEEWRLADERRHPRVHLAQR